MLRARVTEEYALIDCFLEFHVYRPLEAKITVQKAPIIRFEV